MRRTLNFVVIIQLAATGAVWCQEPDAAGEVVREELQLAQGKVSGVVQEGLRGKPHYAFLAIPYSQPPVGDLRFKAPVAAGGWEGVRDASQHPLACLQFNLIAALMKKNISVVGTEDCLYLNVFTPRQPSSVTPTTRLPVMVYIHGGGFISGEIKYYNPSTLLQNDVIIVTLQHRLGLLGFISTEDEVIPGNMGLLDQTLALRWVKDNIHSFGGDCSQVTIFGESSGSVSVHMQVLSPLAEGLFQRAIMQSGTALGPWFLVNKHRECAFKFATQVNCSAKTSQQLLDCFTQLPSEKLVYPKNILNYVQMWDNMPCFTLPRVDGHFLPRHPVHLITTGSFNKVDMMAGITKHEGSGVTLVMLNLSPEALPTLQANFSHYGPLSLMLGEEESPEYLAERAYLRYFPRINFTMDNLDALTELNGDRFFKANLEDSSEFHTRAGQRVFQYQMDYRGEHSLQGLYIGDPNSTLGQNYTCHGDDLLYLFDFDPGYFNMTRPADRHLKTIMIKLWTNFATTGNPTVNGSLGFRWTPTSANESSYLVLSLSPEMRTFDKQTREFWRNLPTKNNKILFPERFLE